VKTWFMFHLSDMNDFPFMERWFPRYHAPEVMRRPLSIRYLGYRVVPAFPGVEHYGYYNYRVHENWSRGDELGGKGSLSLTPLQGRVDAVVTRVPGEPTEDFLGAGLRYEETTVLRWLMFYRYPEGVPVDEGEDWFLNVHAKEVMRQPGLIRFFSSRTLPSDGPLPAAPPGQRPFYPNPSPLFSANWHRVSEQWYENPNGWRKQLSSLRRITRSRNGRSMTNILSSSPTSISSVRLFSNGPPRTF
jgi:hypothetical protein